ncbi:Tubulin binding cofactor C [Novymonas esmeraldas]|uniref:Tubulin binding cofactor C n=1 Tax=Novymonas esmeraldas TaxID=1808958 RepID=A0AAW0EZS9_9TRYP
MASTDTAETERVIREKLEASGQYGKMRAMIMEAALQTVTAGGKGSGSGGSPTVAFQPSSALAEAKLNGITELSLVQEYLQYLGLHYTERVLQLEAGLHTVPLHTGEELQQQLHIATGSPSRSCLSALVHAGAAAAASSSATNTTPTPTPATTTTTTSATAAGGHAALVDARTAHVEGADVDDAASDHNQPGGEDTTYFISRWKRRHFTRHGQVSGQQVQIEYLTDCHTVVLDELDSMTVDDCEGGELVVAACEGSVFLRNCKNMTIHVACKQLRTRDCANINLHIFTSTDPVVEMSHHISFYPFHLRLPGLRGRFAEARLDPKSNRFVHVYDFTPGEPRLPKPHFEVHFPDHGLSMEDRYPSYGAPECPPEIEALLALQLMPAASSESGRNKSYDIRTGAQVWAQAGVAAPVPAIVTAGAAATSTAAAAAALAAPPHASRSSDGSDVDSASARDAHDSSAVAESSVASAATSSSSSSSDGGSTPAQKQLTGQSALPRTGGAAAAALPTPAAHAAGATPGGLDNEEYSSFDDDDDGDDADDKYEVDEDEDDF